MNTNKDDNKQKKQFRAPLLIKIFVLVVISLLVAGVLVAIISQNYRRRRAMTAGGQSAKQGCTIVRDYLNQTDFDKEDFMNTEIAVERTVYLRDMLFPEICEGLNLKYVYLYTIDSQGRRHHLVSIAHNPDDQKLLDEFGYPGSISETPLRENEIAALNGKVNGVLLEVDNKYGHTCNCVMPYYGADGELAAMIGADCDMDYISAIMRKDDIFLFLLGSISLILTVILILIALNFWVVNPIRNLSSRMENYREEGNKVYKRRKVIARDEVTDMQDSYMEMTQDISAYVTDIRKLTSAKVKADVQLQVAKRIQSGMVPPEKEYIGRGCSVYAVMHPALEVGGDFYDVFGLPKGKVGIIIGDISGKGISAALFMAMVHRILHERLKTGTLPAKALKRANAEICRQNPEGFFATVFAAVWDQRDGKLVYSNAGHNTPLLFGKDVKELPYLEGDMLGLYEDAYFKNESVTLDFGEGILLYTDGVTEAVSPEHEAFGMDRLKEKLSEFKADPDTISKKILDDVLTFEGDAGIFDDITVISVCRSHMGRIMLAPDISEIKRLKTRIAEFVNDKELVYNINTASEEWFVNIISYSGAENVMFDIVKDSDLIMVLFFDDGKPFDPTVVNNEDKPFEELDQGGMGIEMIRSMTTEFRYERLEAYNVVTLVFNFTPNEEEKIEPGEDITI